MAYKFNPFTGKLDNDSGITQAAADTRYVNVTGDTMTGGLSIQFSTAGGFAELFLANSSNTASSNADLYVQVAGTSAGDPELILSISGSTLWSLGVDNSDNDTLKIGNSTTVGNSSLFTLDTTGNMLNTGYLRVGSITAPTNTTAGDITGVRLKIGDGAFGTGVDASITGDGAFSGFLRVGSETAPANTTAGDLTFVRGFGGDTDITSVTTGLTVSAGSTSAITLSSVAGTAVGGLLFGTDTTLYRSAASTLKTDDAVVIAPNTSPLVALDLTYTSTTSTTNSTAILVAPTYTGTATGVQGFTVQSNYNPSASISVCYGFLYIAKGNPPTGVTITNMHAGFGRIDTGNDVGVITNAQALFISRSTLGTLKPTSLRGIQIQDVYPTASNAGTTNVIGLQIDSQHHGTSITNGLRITYPAAGTGAGSITTCNAFELPTAPILLGDQTATTTHQHGVFIGIPTYTSTTNTRTLTNAAGLYIAGAPVASTNVTITNGPYSIWVDAGTTRLDGEVSLGSNIYPTTTDTVALGTSSLMFSDLFLASGAVINFNNGDVTLTHSADKITMAGGSIEITSPSATVIELDTALTGVDQPVDILGGSTNVKGIRLYPGSSYATTTAGIQFYTTSSTNFPGQVYIDSGAHDNAAIILRTGPTSGSVVEALRVDSAGDVTFAQNLILASGSNINTNTSTGTTIATTTSQKLGFWGATAIVQPTTAVAAATFTANTSGIANDTATFDGYTLGQVVKALRNAGLLA